MQRYLIVNPRSGTGSPSSEELREAARERGIGVHLIEAGDDLPDLARRANADVLGMAGGDGSLAAVADVAIERDIPFVCIPFGTRNHFARDIGLDRNDPIGALAAFDGDERRIDAGRVGDRLFLNNVSLGLYAQLVHRREHRRRRREALARLRALALTVKDRRRRQRFTIDGEPVRARLVLVANNDYTLELLSPGERERIDEGLLHLYIPHGFRRITWDERSCTELEIDSPLRRLRAAVDGEPLELDTPLRFRIEPRALRVLLLPEPE
jgi:diacylglycerol kinase family enzyme